MVGLHGPAASRASDPRMSDTYLGLSESDMEMQHD
jgi:hypothetical protein